MLNTPTHVGRSIDGRLSRLGGEKRLIPHAQVIKIRLQTGDGRCWYPPGVGVKTLIRCVIGSGRDKICVSPRHAGRRFQTQEYIIHEFKKNLDKLNRR
ncbi:hypothetical protein HYR99_41245 [Candidatus Poribacteria bacterium]|nr:hypothetical protein [Candidatus Poribacteria bacterium]